MATNNFDDGNEVFTQTKHFERFVLNIDIIFLLIYNKARKAFKDSFSILNKTENGYFSFFDHILAAIVHKSFVTTAHPPTGKGGDCGISAFSALPHIQGANWGVKSKL